MGSIIWRLKAIWLGLTMKPIRGGAPDEDGDADTGDGEDGDDGDGKPAGDADTGDEDGDGKGDDDGDAAGDTKDADHYRRQLREYERSSKRASTRDKKEIEKLKKKLKEREDADKSEQEKAVEAARAEGQTEAEKRHIKERRQDRLETQAMRLASKGIKIIVKDGDEEKEKVVKFADPEDALVHLERSIGRGEIDADSIFDDNNQVKPDELRELLVELLEKKPHLREQASSKEEDGKPGDADAGKGAGEDEGGKKLEEMSPEDHYNRIRRHK